MNPLFGARLGFTVRSPLRPTPHPFGAPMRPIPPKMQAILTVALSLVAALSLTLFASGAFAHTGVDGGSHHDLINMSHHLSDLEAWFAALSLGTWLVLPLVLGLCVWLAVRRLQKQPKRRSSSSQKAHRKDQP